MPLRALCAAVLGLLIAASPAAAVVTPNLLLNPGAENGPGATSATETQPPPDWQSAGASVVAYGPGGFPDQTVSQQISGGNNFFAGGTGEFGETSAIVQEIDISSHAALVDSGNATMTLSGAVGGFAGQEDSASVLATVYDPTGSAGATFAQIGPVSNADRQGNTALLPRSACATVPAGMRRAQVSAIFTRSSGTYNDGYLDNLSLTFSDEACPAAGGGDGLEPPAPPQPGVSGNADEVSGTVKVKLPGSNKFVNLEDVSKIPVGTEIDATRGVVSLQTAAGTGGATQTARFSDGAFKMTQPKSAAITELKLSGKLSKCPKPRKGRKADPEVTAAATRRRLWGDGNGRFRTRGRKASASVRGTRWYTEDSCKGTLVRVTQGSVIVRDFAKKKNITVKAPGRYLAK